MVDCIPLGAGNIKGLESAALMPNPNDGNFRIQLELVRPVQGNFHVFNALGQILTTQKIMLPQGASTLPVSLPAPVPGFYWLVLEVEGQFHRIGFEVQ